MASSCSNRRLLLLLAAAVLLSGLAAGRRWEWESQCQPGEAFPHNPLSGCRGYVISRACRATAAPPEMAKARCCRELAAVQPRCRCEALRLFMDGVGELRGCPREAQRPPPPRSWRRGSATCGVAPARRRCYWPWLVGDGDVPVYWEEVKLVILYYFQKKNVEIVICKFSNKVLHRWIDLIYSDRLIQMHCELN